MSEEEVLTIIQNVALALTKFAFGPYDEDDIRQEIAVFCLEALEAGGYDPRPGPDGRPTRPLANFLFRHAKFRAINLVRNKLRRADPPCKSCHEAVPGNTEHEDRQYCPKYEAWLRRQLAKANLLCPMDIADHSPGYSSDSVEDEVATTELLRLIDTRLPALMRSDYLRMREGQSVPKARRLEIENAVKEIINENDN